MIRREKKTQLIPGIGESYDNLLSKSVEKPIAAMPTRFLLGIFKRSRVHGWLQEQKLFGRYNNEVIGYYRWEIKAELKKRIRPLTKKVPIKTI